MAAIKAKKGDEVCLLGFTGMRIGMRPVEAATKDALTIAKADGTPMVFNRKTGVQSNMEPGKEKYAGMIVDAADAPPEIPKKPRTPKPVVAPAPKGKVVNIAPTKGKGKPVVEDDDDGYEEV